MKTYVTTMSRGTQSVLVMNVEGMTGYEFNAVGKESLPLAVELAVMQTQEPWRLEEMMRKNEITLR